MKDTIVATATPQVEKGAIGIVRMSGERALEIVRKVFDAQGFESVEPNKMYLGRITTKNFNSLAIIHSISMPTQAPDQSS